MISRFPALLFAAAIVCAQSDELVRKSAYGKQLMSAGRFAEAIAVYQELVKALPGNPGLVLNLGLAEQMAGQPRQAIRHFEAVLKVQPANFAALFSLASSHLALNEPAPAVEPLRKVIAADPTNRDARGMLAGALFGLGRFDQAAEQYRALVKSGPDDPRAWFGLGRSYESLSGQAFAQLEKSAPDSGYMAALLADTRVQQRQYRSAFYLYRQALEKTPDLEGIHAGLAEVYRRTDHADWAAVEARKEKTPSGAACAARKPACEFLSGRYLESASAARVRTTPEARFWQVRAYDQLARAAFAKLGELPDSPQIHEVKATILRNQNQHLDAVKEWQEAMRLAPGNPAYARELADSLYMAKDYQQALAMFEQFLKAEPESGQLNYMTGDSLLRLGEVDKALPLLEKAVRRDAKLLAARASLGLAYARAGRTAEAIPHLEAALALDEDGSLRYQLARAYQAAGRAEQSSRMMAEYQQIQKKAQADKEDLAKQTEILPPR